MIADLTTLVVERDGPNCWYCGVETTPATRTIEHILARARGGPDDLANLCIACEPHNKIAADWDIVAKVTLRDQFRERLWHEMSDKVLADKIAGIDAIYRRPATARGELSAAVLANLETARLAAERKARAQDLHDRRQREQSARFVAAAKLALDRETWLAIWQQVNNEPDADAQSGE